MCSRVTMFMPPFLTAMMAIPAMALTPIAKNTRIFAGDKRRVLDFRLAITFPFFKPFPNAMPGVEAWFWLTRV